MAPLISVIIPTYNRTRLLVERCLPSVFAQTVQDQEIIVVGDGTEQATVDAMAYLPPIRFWNLPHQDYPSDFTHRWGLLGLNALNFGLDQAKGEWIAVLADDDEWTSDHHEVLLAASDGFDHVYGMADTYKHGKPTGQMYGAWPPGPGQFCNGANLWQRSLDYRFGLDCWDRNLPGDADLWTRMVADGVRFRFVPQTVLHYHRNWP